VGAIRSFAYENIEAIEAARDAYTPGEGSPPTPVSRASRAGA
jgi:hypothetical protein